MRHTVTGKAKLLARIRRVRGQVEAVERALDGDRECGEVLRLIAAARGAMDSLMAEVLEGHIREHAMTPHQTPDRAMATAEDLIDIVRAYLR
jgi:DNA-binding FrmR family transcriptional regulator